MTDLDIPKSKIITTMNCWKGMMTFSCHSHWDCRTPADYSSNSFIFWQIV